MSSPLSWFRKNQKLLLGVFGVGLMFVFTISIGSGVDPIMDRLSGRTTGGPSNSTVVTWDGGQIDENQMNRLQTQRNLLQRFLYGLLNIAGERGARPRVSLMNLSDGDQNLLELEVLVNEAKKMGIVVNDETVIDYLNQLTDGTIAPGEYGQILSQTVGNNLPENALFPILGREIMAQKVRGLVQTGSYPSSPVAAWDYFNRANRLVKAEVMPIQVDDFVDQVEEPAESEIATLFEENKSRYPFPFSPVPGFRQRERRAFQYVKVSYNAILEAEKAAISESDVQQYYDANKQQFVDTGGSLDAADPSATAPDQTDNSGADITTDPAADVVDSAETATQETATQETAAETVDEEQTTGSAADPTPAPTALPQEQEGEVVETAGEVVETASEVVEAAGEVEVAEDAVEATAETVETTSETVVEATETAISDITEAGNSVVGEVVDETAASVETSSEGQTTESDVATEIESTATVTPSEESESAVESTPDAAAEVADDEKMEFSDLDTVTKYKELSEVADEIRQQIAAPKAQAKMKEYLAKVRRDMETYYQDRTLWELDIEENPDTPAPPMPDFSSIIDGSQVTKGEIASSDRIEVREFELGQAVDFLITRQGGVQTIPFSDAGYDSSVSPYRPMEFPKIEMGMDKYVYWVTELKEEYVPELDEVREDVVNSWKRSKALKLAEEAAAGLVATAEKGQTQLRECLASSKYTEFLDTGEVSWITAPLQEGATPQVTRIPGAEDAGPALRKKLFRLPPGGVGYAHNMPKDKVYVFRVAEESSTDAVRQEQFLHNGVDAPVMFQARRDGQMGLAEWYKDLTDRYNVDWQRDPRNASGGS